SSASVRGVLSLDQEVGLSDALLLEPPTEEAFIANLHQRFKRDLIYTYIGSVVVSVNPYKKLALYSPDVIQAYQRCSMFELPPHIYAVADDAYTSLRDRNQDQCVIITGESGAGKTGKLASKLVMQYITAISGMEAEVDTIKEHLLQSAPVLEAFGNAKTHRNDNSSRFGKYIDIEFDFKGDPIGGIITNYLLEKSRVISQTQGERNFHFFYQLLSGADIHLLKSLKLQRNIDNYAILKHSKGSQAENIDDKSYFGLTKRSMEALGMGPDEIHAAFQVVASVLKMGNLQFQPRANIDDTEGCSLLNEYEVYDICELLRVDFASLHSALTQKMVDARHEVVITDLSAMEATYSKNALCKALYSRLFTWLVSRINDSIRAKRVGKRRCLGVLDIYGFEVLEKNCFEQFVINYCNEKLQQLFIVLTLKQEQEEYIHEGIQWEHIDYFNNAIICDLIEKNNHGILAMLDEECLRPEPVSDDTFLYKLTKVCQESPYFESKGCKNFMADASLPSQCFRLRHYAGAVTYSVAGFIDKNNDHLYRDLSQAMYSCDHPLMKILFPEGNPKRTTLKRPTTTATQFKISIGALVKNLQAKTPNYVRCIKPNELKQPMIFEMALVQHQVRYLGLVENLKVRRAGFAFRQEYEAFLERYKLLSPHTWPHWSGLPVEGVTLLLRDLPVHPSEYAFGRTKIFVKNPRTVYELEEFRHERLHELATLIQKTWRGFVMRNKFLRMREGQVTISSNFKCWKARREFLHKRQAASTIAAFFRGWKVVYNILFPHRVCLPSPASVHEPSMRSSPSRRFASRTTVGGSYAEARDVAVYMCVCMDMCKTREQFHDVGQSRRREWAARVLARCYRFSKVSTDARFLRHGLRCTTAEGAFQRRRYLLWLAHNLPSESPLDRSWPPAPRFLHTTSHILKKMYHKWRCSKYRMRFDQTARNRMREKVTASIIFRDRKASYAKSVSHPFRGDYVRLRQNVKWKRLASETGDQYVVFADIISKITRSSGKCVQALFVVSTNAMLIMDQRTLQIKYRIPVGDIFRISLSPFLDDIAVFHVRTTEATRKKGDFLFETGHVIEIVTKLFLVIQNATGKPPEVNIATE
ncbi:myosin IA, putative, partial [Ixodes scapularis]